MTDLSKAIFYSRANAFKNDNALYQGSISVATSMTAGQKRTVSQTFTLPDPPEYSMFFAYYQDYMDMIQQYYFGSGYNGKQWYPTDISNLFSVGLMVTSPAGSAGPINGGMTLTIDGNDVTVSLVQINPYGNSITIQAQTISFAFVEFTLND